MLLRPLGAALALTAALLATGCACCHHHCARPACSSCGTPAVAAASPAPCCGAAGASIGVQAYSVPAPPLPAAGIATH